MPRHRKPQHRDSKTKTSRHCDLDTTKATQHPKTETTKRDIVNSRHFFSEQKATASRFQVKPPRTSSGRVD